MELKGGTARRAWDRLQDTTGSLRGVIREIKAARQEVSETSEKTSETADEMSTGAGKERQGYSVVAEEVRAFAERTARATERIRSDPIDDSGNRTGRIDERGTRLGKGLRITPVAT